MLGELACAPPLTLRQVHGDVGQPVRAAPGRHRGRAAGRRRPVAPPGAAGRGPRHAPGHRGQRGPGPGHRGGAGSLSIRADLAEGSDLIADPGALVVCQGSRVDVRLDLRLGAGAAVDWRELIVLGRTGEPAGQATLRWDVTRLGRPVLRQFVDLSLGLTAGRRVLACALIAGPALAPRTVVASPVAVAQRVDDHTLLVTVLDDDAARATRQLGDLCARALTPA